MKQTPPIEKNQQLTLTIETLTNEGQGVARVEGYAVFVIGALPGETVRAHIMKVTGSYAVGKAIEILSPSPDRTEPRCPVFARCGGCALQHMSYAAQLLNKQTQVCDALTRLGGVTDPVVLPTLGMEHPWQYRNKGSFPFGTEGGGAVFGFFAERSHRLVPFWDCPIQDPRSMDVVRKVCEWANENRISVYDEATQKGLLRHVMVRVTAKGETMAVVVTNGPLKKADALLSAMSGVDSLWHNLNTRDTNVIFGESFTLLSGKSALTETMDGIDFLVSPRSFLQVNPQQTKVLYENAVSFLAPAPADTVVDAYCGIGTISLLLSKSCKRVIGIEQVSDAIQDAKANAAANGMTNTEFICGNVEDVLPALMKENTAISSLILDPPRKGCDQRVLSAIGESHINKLVYVSCNPATLSRDVKVLTDFGFRPLKAQPVDMFPQTAHVECVVLMER